MSNYFGYGIEIQDGGIVLNAPIAPSEEHRGGFRASQTTNTNELDEIRYNKTTQKGYLDGFSELVELVKQLTEDGVISEDEIGPIVEKWLSEHPEAFTNISTNLTKEAVINSSNKDECIISIVANLTPDTEYTLSFIIEGESDTYQFYLNPEIAIEGYTIQYSNDTKLCTCTFTTPSSIVASETKSYDAVFNTEDNAITDIKDIMLNKGDSAQSFVSYENSYVKGDTIIEINKVISEIQKEIGEDNALTKNDIDNMFNAALAP